MNDQAPPTDDLSPIIMIPTGKASNDGRDASLADIHGLPVIVHVWRAAMATGLGPVLVATADGAVIQAVTQAGGRTVPMPDDSASETDRIQGALRRIDPYGDYDTVIQLSDSLPTIQPDHLRMAVAARLGGADVGTLASKIADPAALDDPSVVKVAAGFGDGQRLARAHYFSRAAVPGGDGPHYRHIDVYAFTRRALNRFADSAPTVLERREGLAQLRALDAGLQIDAALVDRAPVQADTPAGLEAAQKILAPPH